jgi:hypothetical protein
MADHCWSDRGSDHPNCLLRIAPDPSAKLTRCNLDEGSIELRARVRWTVEPVWQR